MRGYDPNFLIQLASSGGGFELDATGYQVETLIRIAAAASNKGAQIRLHFAGLDTNDLLRIASAGSGSVVFIKKP